MSKADYYEILNVSRDASPEEIKKSYRRLAMEYHPDRNPGDKAKAAEEKFKQVKEAYEVLKDPKKRSVYDQYGHDGMHGGMGGGNSWGSDASFDIHDLGDLFGEMFGVGGGGRSRSGRRGGGRQQGSDLIYPLELSLENAVHGKTLKIQVPTLVSCLECHGSGSKKGTQPVTCQTCGGHGQVRMQQGFLSIAQTCPECRGQGQVIKDPCSKCRGQGRIQQEKTLSVRIPAGIDTGDKIRLKGEGEAGLNGGSPGDLYVQIKIRRHPLFVREHHDLRCEIPISFITAALGGEIQVPTLDGQVKLKIPPETQSGKLFRLRGKGVHAPHQGVKGDLFCKVTVETPINLTNEQKELLTQLAASLSKGGEKHNPKSKSWFDNVKQFFEGLTS